MLPIEHLCNVTFLHRDQNITPETIYETMAITGFDQSHHLRTFKADFYL